MFVDVNMSKMPDVAKILAIVALFADGPNYYACGNYPISLCHIVPYLGLLPRPRDASRRVRTMPFHCVP